jgi:hypothetical protein
VPISPRQDYTLALHLPSRGSGARGGSALQQYLRRGEHPVGADRDAARFCRVSLNPGSVLEAESGLQRHSRSDEFAYEAGQSADLEAS